MRQTIEIVKGARQELHSLFKSGDAKKELAFPALKRMDDCLDSLIESLNEDDIKKRRLGFSGEIPEDDSNTQKAGSQRRKAIPLSQ